MAKSPPDTTTNILLPGQKTMLTNYTVDSQIISAGLGWGKSWFGARWLMHRIFENYRRTGKPSTYMYSILNYSLLKNLTLEFFKDLFSDMNMREGVHYFINLTNYTVKLYTGDVIICVSAQNYRSVVSYNISCLVADEISSYPDEMFPYLLERCRANTPICQTLRIGVPEPYATDSDYFREMSNMDNWEVLSNYTVNYGGKQFTQPRFMVRKIDGLSGKPQVHLCMFGSTLENCNVNNLYIDRLWSQYGWCPDYAGIKIFGQFRNPNKAATVELSDESIINCPSDDAISEKVIAFDFNIGMTTWVLAERHDKYKIVVCDSNDSSAHDTEDAVNQIIQKYPPDKYGKHTHYNFKITGDATGQRKTTNSKTTDVKIIKNILSQYYNIEMVFPKSNPSVFQSLTGLRRVLAANARTGEPIKLYFHKKQLSVINSLKNLETDKNGKIKKASKSSQDKHSHSSDCVRYIVDYMEPIEIGKAANYRLFA